MTELGQTVSKNVFNSFVTKLNNDSKIKVLGNKMKDATDYEVANEYAVRVGEIASEALQTETKGLAYISNEVAQEVLEPILNANYEIVKEATKQVQQNMNTANGLGVEVLSPDLDTSRIQGLVDKVSSYATAEEGNWVLGEPIVNYTQAIVDQSIHKNAKVHSKLGLEPVIIRKTESSGTRYKKIRRGKKTYSYPYKVPCKWCSGLAGTYNYSEVRETGNDVFRRHENCRCLIVYKEGNKVQDVRAKTDWTEENAEEQKKIVEEEIKEKEEKQKDYNPYENRQISKLKQYEENLGVYNNPVKELKEKLTDEQIIQKLAGGDLTGGSCQSLAFAYIGNKNGLDVIDYRGGESRFYFSQDLVNKDLLEFKGIKSYTVSNLNGYKMEIDILKKVEDNKQYMLSMGKHTAIVKKEDGKLFYLELQSGIDSENGFKPYTKSTSNRFGLIKTRSILGQKIEQEAYLYDIDSFKDNEAFKEMLGFLNTMEDEQKKGVRGGLR